ncbi:MAG TPA: YceI family protein [Acidimicrobiales bacterium]|nr:YceI family protein [Acidimicrobiales bacterium]
MTEVSTALDLPGYVVGRWNVDPVHSEVGFSVRHMMVSKVRGKFTKYELELITADNPLDSSVTASIDLDSIDTGQPDRDNHLRSADFFEVTKYPTLTYRSTGIRPNGDDFILDGELTLKGVTKPVSLHLELGGFGPDPYGGTRAGFTATGEILRSDFHVDFNAALETGGVVVGDKINLHIEIEAVLAS